jgi:hypothetical protein
LSELGENNVVERNKSGPWTDLGLTLPIFVAYHLGVIVLPVRNAADWTTRELIALADDNLAAYGALTLAIAAIYIGVLGLAGRGKQLHWHAFALLAAEGVIYAVAMRAIASSVVGELYLRPPTMGIGADTGVFAGLILSCGAGFYEEVMFRVALFGGGLKIIKILFPLASWHKPLVFVGWALVTSMIFSLWHYIGPLGDPLDGKSFVFRWVCGLVFCLIFAFRGFAPAVWTHALYDIWVLVL